MTTTLDINQLIEQRIEQIKRLSHEVDLFKAMLAEGYSITKPEAAPEPEAPATAVA